MGCYFSKARLSDENPSGKTNYNEALLDKSEDGSSDDYKRSGPQGTEFPTWMKDEESESCMSCSARFSAFGDRKHHCRRCRNIYCGTCTLKKSKILLFSISEEVRVCDRCYTELQDENYFIGTQRPLLHQGDTFKKSIMMGLSTKVVTLRVMADDKTLVYDDDTRREPTAIVLHEVERVNMTSLKAFEILLDGGKSFCFEAGAPTKLWVEAIKMAIKRARDPPLRERVECERRQRVELKKRSEGEERRRGEAMMHKDSRKTVRENIKGKYGM